MPEAETDPYAERPSWWAQHAASVLPPVVGLLTVVLTVVAFPPFKAPEFAYVCLVPGILWAYERPRLRTFAWTLGIAQAVAWVLLLAWLRHVTWLGLLLLGPFAGIWTGLWYLAAWWAMPRLVGRPTPVRLVAVLGLAGAWTVLEWTRTFVLGGFPWLPLAASQWERTTILQIAAYTGAGGVSFVLVAMNVGFAAYAHRLFREGQTGLRRRSPEFFLALFLLVVCLTVFVRETANRGRYAVPFGRVAFVQPDVPQDVKWDPARGPAIARGLADEIRRDAVGHPDLILLPESVTPWALKGPPEWKNFVDFMDAQATQAGAPLLVGSDAIEPGPPGGQDLWYNAAFVVAPDRGVQPAYYAKRKLVPFGEFVPLRWMLGWLSKFVPIGDGDYSRGTNPAPLVTSVGGSPAALGVLICYEDVYPDLARATVRSGADALTVITNDAWFGEEGEAYQHAAHSVLRAVETRRPVLRCGNAGWTGWIDEFGSVRSVLDQPDRQVFGRPTVYFRGTGMVDVTRDFRWIGRESAYVRYGDWFIAASALAAVFAAALLATGRESRREARGPLPPGRSRPN